MTGLIVFTAIFGGALWYMQNYAFYEEYTVQDVEIAGVLYPVTEFQGIDATSSPLKLRACFTLQGTVEAPPAPEPVPLVAPGWFECFDAEAIAQSLASGEATAFLAAAEDVDGVNRIIAVYGDGRAYMWRQLNERFAK